jgi:PHD/YefM family antitoxin component YafN of YafNO toxin-antitoxin module
MELRERQKELLDIAYQGEILLVARPARKNVVVMSEEEFNKREKALRNTEYLAMLNQSLAEAQSGEAYEYLGNGTFSDTPQKIDL